MSLNNDFVAIEYSDVFVPDPSQFQTEAWSDGNLQYYNFVAADIPAQVAVEYRPGISGSQRRRLWMTGSSWGGTSAEDWATQFLEEQDP